MNNLEKTIAKAFLEMADGLESGSFGKKPRIALTGLGSEHGEENAMEAARIAAQKGVDVYYIGTLTAEGVTTISVSCEEEGHRRMEEMVESGEVDYRRILDGFYNTFAAELAQAEIDLDKKRIKVPDEESDEICELCGKRMVIKAGRFGKFLACPG